MDDRVRKIVDEEIARQSQKARQGDDVPTTAPSTTNARQAAGDAGAPNQQEPATHGSEALASMKFLEQLDELLSRLKPELPSQFDGGLVRCITQQQTDSDGALKGALEGVVQQKREREKYRNDVAATYYGEFLPIHARIDYRWKTSTYARACVCFDDTATTPEDDPKKGRPYFHFDGKCGYSNCRSGDVSKIYKKPIFEYAFDYFPEGGPTYSWLSDMTTPQPPLLMRLMDKTKLGVPTRLYCQVHEVAAKRDVVDITCRRAPGEALSIVAHGNPAGTLKVHAGDLISVPLANTERGAEGVLRKEKATWLADADIGTIVVEAAVVCPTRDTIIATAPKPKRVVSDDEDE
jgi:hypothetical protein